MREKFLAQTFEFRSPDNADYLARGAHKAHVFADRIFVGEMATLKRFVNEGDHRRAFDIAISEKASGAQWNSHDAKVISAHLIVRSGWLPLCGDRRMLIDRVSP